MREFLERHEIYDARTSVKIVALTLRDMGWACRQDIMDEGGLAGSTTSRSLSRLVEKGVVEMQHRMRKGRRPVKEYRLRRRM